MTQLVFIFIHNMYSGHQQWACESSQIYIGYQLKYIIHCKRFRPIPDPIPNHFVDLPNWVPYFSEYGSNKALLHKIPNQCSRKERKRFHIILEYKYHISCYVVTLNQSSRNFSNQFWNSLNITRNMTVIIPESRLNLLKLLNLSRFFICDLNLAREFLCQNLCSETNKDI